MPLQPHRLALPALVALPLVMASCADKDEDTGTPYCAPTGDAGADQSVAFGNTVDLDGSASGYAENCRQDLELTWQWAFDAVPVESAVDAAALTDNGTTTASTTSFVPDVLGTYVISLQVCDELNCSDVDIVVVEVSSTDAPPVADAGADVTTEAGLRTQLDGSGSYDPEGAELSYSWALSSTPDCSQLDSSDLFNQTTASPSLICDCEGIFVASLVVSDGLQWSQPDYASVTCTSGNQAPIADAGDFTVLPPCTEDVIELNGYGSYDPEGEPLEYIWSVVSVPTDSATDDASFDDPSRANPTFAWDVEGDYTFQLEVYDGELWSAPDIATITVQSDDDNTSPVANAGDNQSTDATSSCSSSSYVWSCDDCDPQDFELDGSGSFDDDGDSLTYAWSDPTGQVSIGSPQSASTVVYTPAMASSYGTATRYSWSLELEVADCAYADSDSVTITVNCTGSQ
ncbi:MAG: hypothetical protein H6739_32435 [Alphaproteobacteria bacterium]|nr:hypothetical protein [Alphaproteobacteria bacterium]